ncbi:hypothetical protein CVV68_01210 [Arthrobacter livingstonensis]|uniref:Uncharacterized protein n=1 Tax=Arthrobacter livingstonensis TaxID=670078 RepID=A0A2V5M003_9MICC|nr:MULTISPECIES: hypothetical protein [Arthrobacter]MDJ0315783.1 hypothetical protein [Arthrobacter sp. H35-MC1]PYI69757.1 hypothetical protein CVV68_01210 [Arthrobacter livingstonensis]
MADNESEPLPPELFLIGQTVALRSSADLDANDIWHNDGEPLFLYRGHPGRITDPNLMHILVEWAGFENSDWSLAFGFTASAKGPCSGLMAITEDEYDRRCKEIAAGKRPTLG